MKKPPEYTVVLNDFIEHFHQIKRFVFGNNSDNFFMDSLSL